MNAAKLKNWGRELVIDSISGILMAVSVQVFAVNANFAPGGLNGLGIIINYLTGLPIGAVVLVLNIPIILFSFRILGKQYLIRSVQSMIVAAFYMDHVAIYFPAYTGSPMLAAIFSGIFAGVGCAVLFMADSCTGGSDFLILSFKKLRPQMSVGQLVQAVDGSVLILAAIVFRNIDAVLYGLIYTIIQAYVVDKMMYNQDSGKLALIITKAGQTLCTKIDEAVGRGSTRFAVAGGYQGDKKEMVMCVCSRKQIADIRRVVKAEDPQAFMIITEFTQVIGNGFLKADD